jgi:hypothetical protein
MLNKLLNNTKGDRWIWLIVIMLSVISLLAVYSAIGTLAYKKGVGAESILMKHFAMIVGGIALMYISHKLDYQYYRGIPAAFIVHADLWQPCKRCQQVDSHSGHGLKLSNLRLGQAGADHLPGAHVSHQTGKH